MMMVVKVWDIADIAGIECCFWNARVIWTVLVDISHVKWVDVGNESVWIGRE